ncbi:MAG: ATP-dependent DNA helicase RecG [Oscillatoriales cyanobacterium SM2_2_1]|nr:ATP-dependent DNA helicase RecG [Oscillatoriales cyanobacterium SM2_2_1]
MDVIRIEQALRLEMDRGFPNLQGRQYRFAEFLHVSLETGVPDHWRDRSTYLATQYAAYERFSLAQRQHLVAETRRLLDEITRPVPVPAVPKKPKTEALIGKERLDLVTPLTAVTGIGPATAKKLARLELFTVQDVLHYYPRDHVDYAQQVEIRALTEGQTVTVIGEIRKFSCFTSPKNPNLTIMEIWLRDATGQIKLSRFWTGRRYSQVAWQQTQKRLHPLGATIAASGVVKRSKWGVTLEGFDLEILDHRQDTITSTTVGRVVPVYPLTEGVSPELIRRTVLQCLPACRSLVDPLPEHLRHDYHLVPLGQAIAQMHYPEDGTALTAAAVRLTFDKYFYRRLVGLYRRQHQRAIAFAPQNALVERLASLLPFQLTGAQQRVIAEIQADLQRFTPMNRLVQGDVGSGKTIVAVYALLTAIAAGYQTALMAPTEVLSEQHYRKILDWFSQLPLPVELLTGSTRTSKRREILAMLETGELPLIIGTHALIQEGVNFARLGLVVIDEQHRFGRDQRSRLVQKGSDPHVLIMTATPIPRTLYLTNSEIEVSIIDELPPGRQPIQTSLLRPGQRKHAYDLIRRELAQGRQAYIVLPLVEESEKMADVRAAIQEQEHLQHSVFPNFRVGLLHGQMSPVDKDAAITQFRSQNTQILVATTVIEVGVDIPNATVMLIEHSDRFGLAQLHQLRGRVGRGAAQSYCILISDAKGEEAQERLGVLVQSQDGFFIAERDFQLRGKGKDEGTEQSGHAGMAIEDRLPDEAARQEVYQMARAAAERVITHDPSLKSFPRLTTEFERQFQRLQGGTIFT